MWERINGVLLGSAVPAVLIGAGLFFCIRLGFFHLLRPGKMLRAILGRGRMRESLRGLSLSLAGTLGVGNLVGVAGAIVMGGSGAVFWMWISALCAMLLKYAEIVLAVRHRRRGRDGEYHGAAMYYISDCYEERRLPRLGRVLSVLFAVLCLVNALSVGSAIQVHAVAEAFESEIGLAPLLTGLAMAGLTLLVIRRGTGAIVRLTERLVPLMTVGFLFLSVAVLILRRGEIPAAFASIFENAFRPRAAAGGVGGFFLSAAVRYGTMRGLISNEAGSGTAPAAHAVSRCESPAAQGVFGIVEVFVDTVLLCTVTALVILVSGVHTEGEGNFMSVTLNAYRAVLGNSAALFLAVAVLLFGFATVVCWAHYGTESVRFLSPRRWARGAFLAVYLLAVCFGAVVTADWLWEIADLSIGIMTLINVTVLCLMNGEVKRETAQWLAGSSHRAERRE